MMVRTLAITKACSEGGDPGTAPTSLSTTIRESGVEGTPCRDCQGGCRPWRDLRSWIHPEQVGQVTMTRLGFRVWLEPLLQAAVRPDPIRRKSGQGGCRPTAEGGVNTKYCRRLDAPRKQLAGNLRVHRGRDAERGERAIRQLVLVLG